MITNPYVGSSARHSGDINLVAALMAMGIPLDTTDPVSVVENYKGTYGSFSVCDISDDGMTLTETLMEYWNGTRAIPHGYGFGFICDFIRARPRGVQSTADLLDFAVSYLQERGHNLPGFRTIDDAPSYVAAMPTGEPSYVLAYVANREVCYKIYNRAKRKSYHEQGQGQDTRRAIIDTRLPRWQAKELLSRLQG